MARTWSEKPDPPHWRERPYFFVLFFFLSYNSPVTLFEQRFSIKRYLNFVHRSKKNKLTEFELIKGCIKHDVNCQRRLFEQYAGKMMTVCLRYANDMPEAEDILQEGFIRVFNNLHQFKFEGSFEGWVRRVVVNCALKHIQKKRISFSEIKEHGDDMPQIESYVFSSLGEEELLKLIEQLPTGYKLVFNLNVIEGYSHEEIGNMLGIQPSTSRSQLVKARKMLQYQIRHSQKIAV